MTVDRNNGIIESFEGGGTTGPFRVTVFNVQQLNQIEPGGVIRRDSTTGVGTVLLLNDTGDDGYTAEISNGLVEVTTVATVDSGFTLEVTRSTLNEQTVPLPVVGQFNAEDVEKAFDLIVMQMQEIDRLQSPFASLAFAEITTLADTLDVSWADSAIAFDSVELELSVVIEQFGGAGGELVELLVSNDGGATFITTGYDWSLMFVSGTTGSPSPSGQAGSSGNDILAWKFMGTGSGKKIRDDILGRMSGMLRFSRLLQPNTFRPRYVGSFGYVNQGQERVVATSAGALTIASNDPINAIRLQNFTGGAGLRLDVGTHMNVRGVL